MRTVCDPLRACARFRLNQPSVVAETIDGEVMAIDLESGTYYSVAGAGAAIFDALVAGRSIGALRGDLAATFDADNATLEADLDRFAQQLLAEGVLVPDADAADAGPELPTPTRDAMPRAVYTGLRFERYDDMRALLVVDPVHEVGDFGWPQRAEAVGTK